MDKWHWELDAAVQRSDFQKLRSIVTGPASPYFPSDFHGALIDRCRLKLVEATELFIKGYVVVSLNRRNQEQERVILLTDQRLVHVKIDFTTREILHTKSIPYDTVSFVQVGNFSCSSLYGMRLVLSDRHGEPQSRTARLYRPLLPESCPQTVMRAVASEMVAPVGAALGRRAAGLVSQAEIPRPSAGIARPLSAVYNMLHLGMHSEKDECMDEAAVRSHGAEGEEDSASEDPFLV
jgi:hypothetical protein